MNGQKKRANGQTPWEKALWFCVKIRALESLSFNLNTFQRGVEKVFVGQTFSEVVGTGTPPWGLAHHWCMSTSFAAGLASLIDGAMKERCLAFH